ncbi:hypothetical protein [Thermoflexus sp.]|uniref:hypothetical protein n=1 Tax=Thermoflexus sp. TaxID=1969742 RepID=UPI0017F2A256|nr:hypothetical protein [Thermoflexus sp.]
MKKWKIGLIGLSAVLTVACQRPTPTPTRIEEEAGPRAPAPATPTTVPSPTPRLTPTVPPSPTPRPIPTAALGPSCAAPPIPGPQPPFTTRAAQQCLHLHLEANEEWAHDGYEIAAMIGYPQQPPCAAFGLAISWQVTAGNGEGIVWILNTQGVERMWKGPQGAVLAGCSHITLRNTGAGPVDLDVRVVVDTP